MRKPKSKLLSILSAILSALVCLIISALVVKLALPLFGNIANTYTFKAWIYLTISIYIWPIAHIKFSRDIKYLRHNYNQLVLAQVLILGFSLLLLVIGILRGFYHMNPENNFRAYVKERKYVVSLIETKQLKVDKLTQTSRGNQEKTVNLPEEYLGLSRNGQVRAIGEGNSLEVIFIHSTSGFGSRVAYIIYRADGDQNKISVISYMKRSRFVVKQLNNQWFVVGTS